MAVAPGASGGFYGRFQTPQDYSSRPRMGTIAGCLASIEFPDTTALPLLHRLGPRLARA